MSNTLPVRIVEDGETSPIVHMTITNGEPTAVPWDGLLLDAPTRPAGATLTLRVASTGPLEGWAATVTVRRGGVLPGQPVVGCTPLEPASPAAINLASDNPDLARRNNTMATARPQIVVEPRSDGR